MEKRKPKDPELTKLILSYFPSEPPYPYAVQGETEDIVPFPSPEDAAWYFGGIVLDQKSAVRCVCEGHPSPRLASFPRADVAQKLRFVVCERHRVTGPLLRTVHVYAGRCDECGAVFWASSEPA